MQILTDSDFRKQIKYSPANGYLFFGEEDYLKLHAVEEARKALLSDPSFAAFNEIRLDAIDFEPQKLLDALMPLPMMADKKLILLTGLNFNSMKPTELEDFCEILSLLPTYDFNTLILPVASDCLNVGFLPKKPSAVFSKLTEFLTPVQFDTCSTAKLTSWVEKHFAQHGISASSEICALMPDYCGHSMFILANEIDKLCYYLLYNQRNCVEKEDVRRICTSATEYDAFGFTNAILEGKSEHAFSILYDYEFRRVDPIIIFTDVARVVCDLVEIRSLSSDGASAAEISSLLKMHEYKVSLYQKSLRQIDPEKLDRMLSACAEADSAIKLTSDGYPILEKLICSFSV